MARPQSGWDEEKCRNFIIRSLEWVPRNYEYHDGLSIIHRQLEIAFGDENGHLSNGVLEELIEADAVPPFPESMFQRWKWAYRHRKESLEAPSTPHGRTILLPLDRTQGATENNLTSVPSELIRGTLAPVLSNLTTPEKSGSDSSWSIPYTTYVSSRGQKTRVFAVPTKEELQNKFDDPSFGRGGKIVSDKLIEPPLSGRTSFDDEQAAAGFRLQAKKPPPTDASFISFSKSNQPSTRDPRRTFKLYRSWLKARCQHLREVYRLNPPASVEDLTKELVNELNFIQYTKQMFQAEAIGNFDYQKHLQDQHWPSNVEVPNANFARKHRLVPRGESLPMEITHGTRQHTLNEEDLQIIEKLWAETAVAIRTLKLRSEDLFSTGLRQRFFTLYTSKYKSPFPTSLFYDTGLDFRWADSNHTRNESTPSRASAFLEANLEDILSAGQGVITNTQLMPNLLLDKTVDSQASNDTITSKTQAQVYAPRTSSLNWNSTPFKPSPLKFSDLASSYDDKSSEAVQGSLRPDSCPKQGLADEKNKVPAARDHSSDNAYLLDSMTSIPPFQGSPKQRTLPTFATHAQTAQMPSRKLSSTRNTQSPSHDDPISSSADHTEAQEPVQKGFFSRHKRSFGFGFDGACDDESEDAENLVGHLGEVDNIYQNTHQLIIKDNTYILSTFSNLPAAAFEMDLNKSSGPSLQSENPAPLRINKQSKQVRIAKVEIQRNTSNNTSPNNISPTFPPRTSSLRNTNGSPMSSGSGRRRAEVHTRQQSDTNSGPSSRSSHRDRYLSDASAYPPSQETTRSTVSSFINYHSGSTDIIGNFMPFDKMAKPGHGPNSVGSNVKKSLDTLANKPAMNPYQFEPDTPLPSRHYSHQTTFTDFITDPHDTELASSPEQFYMKKSPSAGNAIYNDRKATPMVPFGSKPGARLQRCESSPNVSSPNVLMSAQFKNVEYRRSPSPDLVSRYGEIGEATPVVRRGRSPSPQHHRGRSYDAGATPVAFGKSEGYFREFREFRSDSPLHAPTANEQIQSYLKESRPESPYRPPTSNAYYQSHVRDGRQVTPIRTDPRNADDVYGPSSGNRARSPTKMRDVVEMDDIAFNRAQPPSSPQKRSRSPMKKMFGDHGWLGRSPAEATPIKHRDETENVAVDRKGKKTMMGKLKTKLGEFAEKADLGSPVKGSRYNDKPAAISILSVSLGPPEQARIAMEIELMLVHTANSFIMNQFSQGRMSVDSIKKTVDVWKGKGRPTVIEFMYDQATQRDLVAVNQHNFRFHGDRAGDSVRVNSMLYTWKLVASQMAIRTFCDADTVILKLLFDIEQILEMLGGPGTLLHRLQQIRATATERMRLARHKKEHDSKQRGPADHGRTWHSHSSDPVDGPTIRESLDDPYGGLKLVPDNYREYN